MTIASLPRPKGHEDRAGPEIWVDEAIWGHRLHDEQTPWLTVLEFLCVLQAEHVKGRAMREDALNTLSYRPQTQLRLRNLVFNNPHIATVLAEKLRDDAAWSSWHEKMKQSAGGLEAADFGYLQTRFANFSDFASVIGFLQSSAIEGNSNKRWSSKFVFPFGANALFEDVAVSPQGNVSTDRRFFARTGELLYLMLTRSARAEELRDRLTTQFLESRSPYDRLLAALQGPTQDARQDRGGAYLPCAAHPLFDRLADDWISILDRPISLYDAIPHLVHVTGLNLALYQLDRAREVLGADPVSLVCEIVSPRKSVVRDLSANSFQRNNALPQQAVEHHVRSVTESTEWEAALSSAEPSLACAEVLQSRFDWPDPDDKEESAGEPQVLLGRLIDKVQTRHRQHVGKIHAAWTRAIGLSSRRSSRRVRYAPTDRLLKTLVVCCVPQRLEFREFLTLLHSRYGFVIGEHQAKEFVERGEADQEDFSDNARRLEDRLASLGLLRRLSDSCAYVENPFARGSRR